MEISILGKNIEKLRTAKGWSKSKLKELSNVGYATIHDIESGKTQNLNTATINKLAIALNVTPNILLGIEEIEIINHVVEDIEDTLNAILECDDLKFKDEPLTEKDVIFLKNLFDFGLKTLDSNRSTPDIIYKSSDESEEFCLVEQLPE